MATKKAAVTPPAPAPVPAPAAKRDSNAGKAPTSTRSLWKGAISFGLVHVPIALYSATDESDLSFKMLDKRSMDPVGYNRINKKSGKEVGMADIVKGIEGRTGDSCCCLPKRSRWRTPRQPRRSRSKHSCRSAIFRSSTWRSPTTRHPL